MFNLSSLDAALHLRDLYRSLFHLASVYADDKEKPVGAAVMDWASKVYLGFNVYPAGEAPAPDKSNIIHAEDGAIAAYEESKTESGVAVIVTTKAPCLSCAKRILSVSPMLVIMPAPEEHSSWFSEQKQSVVLFKTHHIRVAYASKELTDACK